MTVTYDPLLVVISALIAMTASFVTLEMAGLVTESYGKERTFWLAMGAISMGVGIWSMHFIAMLAFSIPIYITYNFPLVFISLIAAVIASAQALYIASRPKIKIPTLLVGSLCMGLAIAGMHYIGMMAMEMPATLNYDPFLFVLSVIIAIVVSLVALKLAYTFRNETGIIGKAKKVVSAVVMGFAVLSMHYTGMAAAMFNPDYSKVIEFGSIDNSILAIIVTFGTVTVLGFTLFVLFATAKPEKV